MLKDKKKLLLGGLILLTLITIPLTVFLSQQEQENRSSAAAASTMYFNPTTSSSSPLRKSIDDVFTIDVMVNPGTNKVSTIRYEILYDDSRLALEGNTPVTINNNAFPANLEGPILGGGRIAGSVSIGSDYNIAVTTPTKVATIRLKAINPTAPGSTSITFTSRTQVLSVGSSEQAAENVLSTTNPAYIAIASQPTPTPTPSPKPPTLTLTASPNSVAFNGSSTLSWSSSNATSCLASNGWSGSKSISGSQSTGPLTSDKTYTLSCSGPGGSIVRSVAVSVGSAPAPTNTPTPTPTLAPKETSVKLTVYMHGIGNSGDNANPTAHSLSNKNPLRRTRPVEVEVYNSNDTLVTKKSGSLTYNSTNGNFTGTVNLGTGINSDVYTIKVSSTYYLTRRISGIQTLTEGSLNTLPQVTLVTGDTNDDNALNILDYNMIIGCYSDFAPAVSCTSAQKTATDITDDGDVNQFDYNLFLRDLSVQNGD